MDNRGGKREGSGRKPQYELSDAERKRLVKAARDRAKKEGKHISELLVDLAYQQDDKRTSLQAIKTYFDQVIVKASEKDVHTDRPSGPAIMLPPKKQDPALAIIKGGKEDAKKKSGSEKKG